MIDSDKEYFRQELINQKAIPSRSWNEEDPYITITLNDLFDLMDQYEVMVYQRRYNERMVKKHNKKRK